MPNHHLSKARASARFLLGLRKFLNEPLSFDDAVGIIARRMEQRGESFLRMVRRCVYGNTGSPYLPLLHEAGCEYGDMVSGIQQHGLEALLKGLKDAGVWIAFDEYKGRTAIARNGQSYPVRDDDFDNPIISRGLEASSGGTSGRATRFLLDLDFLAARACYDHVMFRMLDIYDRPLALWYPRLPVSIGLSVALRYAKIAHPPRRWFDLWIGGRIAPAWHGMANNMVIAFSRLSAAPLPWPQPVVPLTQPRKIVDWIVETRRRFGRCVMQCNVSSALRLCREAAIQSIDLKDTQFIVGSEPFTTARQREIEAVNATAFPRYHAADVGTIGTGCGNPAEVGEVHLVEDTVFLFQDHANLEVGDPAPFYLTSFLDNGPKVLLNVQLGDVGIMRTRRCGCLLDRLGFHTHLSQVRSVTRSTAEGNALPYADLARLTEELLPARYGGGALDYQWAESEDEHALVRLTLRIDPRLGAINEAEVMQAIWSELRQFGTPHRLYAQIWKRAGTIRIARETPRATAAGKLPAVMVKHREESRQ